MLTRLRFLDFGPPRRANHHRRRPKVATLGRRPARTTTPAGPKCERDTGVTLVELLVVMGVSSVVGAITLGLFLGVNTASRATTDHDINAAQARSTLQLWSRYLAVADSPTAPGSSAHRFERITPGEVMFYADLGNREGDASTPPTLVWLAHRGDNLVTETFRPTSSSYPGTYPTAPTACQVQVNGGVRDGTIFTGLASTTSNQAGVVLGSLGDSLVSTGGLPDSPCWPLPGSGGVAAVSQPDAVANANLAEINSVAVSFTVVDTLGQHPQTYATTVRIGGGL